MDANYVTVNGKEFTILLDESGTIVVNGTARSFDVQRIDARSFSLLEDGIQTKVVVEGTETGYAVLVNGKRLEVSVESERTRLLRKFNVGGSSHGKRSAIIAPMPALVVRLEVSRGQDVQSGQGLIILEAMKMENEIKAHAAGKVKEIYVTKGKPVEKGELLMLLE